MTIDLKDRAAVLITTLIVLSGCGLEGDLYLPEEQPAAASETENSGQSTEGESDTPDKAEDKVED